MFRLAAAAAAALALTAPSASARPFTVDDLLHVEAFGQVVVDPSGRWLVAERRDPYDTASRYDAAFATSQALSRLVVVDLTHPGPGRPLVAGNPAGLLIAGFSPSGQRLAVYQIEGHAWRLGVVDVRTGAAEFFAVTPETPRRGRALEWLSDSELLVLTRPDGHAPSERRDGWLEAERLPGLLDAAASGLGAHTILGSGAYAPVRSHATPDSLARLNVLTGATTEIAAGPFIDLELSPDGSRVALLETGADLQPRPGGPVRGPAGSETERTALRIVDLKSKATVHLQTDGDFLLNLLAWSPNGNRLLLYARGADGLWPSGHLVEVEIATGAATSLAEGLELDMRQNPVAIRAGWMGETPIAYARTRTGGSLDWYAVDAVRPLSQQLKGDKTLVAVDSEGLTLMVSAGLWRVGPSGEAQPVRDGSEVRPALTAFRGTQGSRLINALPAGAWMVLAHHHSSRLAWVDGQGIHGLEGLPEGSLEGARRLVAVSRATGAVVFMDVDAHGVGDLSLQKFAQAPQVVGTVNGDLAHTDPPRVLPVHHRDFGGRELTSWLYLPPTTQGGPPPLIVRPYLGANYPTPPRDPDGENGFFQNLRMLTGHGYAVLVPSLPNPPGGMSDPMDHVADRILAVVQAAEGDPDLKGRFDGERMALLGWSFGGYTTMAAITQTQRFRAAVEMDGISDLVAYWSSLGTTQLLAPEDGYASNWRTGTVEETQPELRAPPWADLARYTRNSPLLAADRIQTPLLLIHGFLDGVPLAGSEAMYSALFRQGKDALFVTYWGALHTVTSPGDVRDVYARTFAFLDEHLGT